MAVTAAEQYLIELINRARLDPLAEAARYGLGLNADLPAGTIDGTAREVLSPNGVLEQAAINHSLWMLDEDIFAHEGEGDSDPGDRIAAAGYSFTGPWTWRENLAWAGTTGDLDLTTSINQHHEGLYRSAGHRTNTFSDDIREIGVAQIQGDFTQSGTTYNASMLTLNFARSGSDHFITGVVYRDSDNDDFYSIGEGQSGMTIAADGGAVQSVDTGGYGLGVTPGAAVSVTVSDGGAALANLILDLGAGNVKLDVVTATDDSQSLFLSGSATLVSGIADAVLLGVADLDLTGNSDDNSLIGNAGRNTLDGGAGNDTLEGGGGADNLIGGVGNDILRGGEGREVHWDTLATAGTDVTTHADMLNGGDGDDRLHGQSGRDMLVGGAGDDRYTGGGGRDTFVFSAGNDRILDFSDNVDMVQLDGTALGLGSQSVSDVVAGGTIVDGNAVFDFGGGNSLQINDVDDLNVLLNDLMIV